MLEDTLVRNQHSDDVHILHLEGKTVLLIGTAHISQESVDLVRQVITLENPDTVCLELDDKRYKVLMEKKRWQALDLKEVIKNKQLSTLMINMLMASYQKKLGSQLGVTPGAELLAAAETADRHGIPIALCDRDVRITLRRTWKSTSFFKKGYLFAALLGSLFDRTEVSEEKLAELRQKDVLAELMDEMGDTLPDVKRVLIDERDIYLAEKIRTTPGGKIVAVVGAGHISGIIKHLQTDNSSLMEEISTIPPVSRTFKFVGWAIPLVIIGSLVTIGFQKGASVAGANLLYWILANGIPSAAGAVLAMAHPFTTIGAFAAAPITSLTPVIGAGYVTAFIQVMVCPPVVREFETVAEDMLHFACWWKNKLLRVFLVFILTGLGSAIGTWIGGVEIVKNLMS
ncbi:TraB/GumN family protein [Desulfopila inferna]|uniref:TraB/GumN family protein n=1 Tax=Desulfopila inferna TaxID=468528 RepID=UPI001962CF3D|nr:TraB/GumN family protein [Desulfopila inferna]MBM9604569.1 TraB/GumN family protein [Desulfopila inferna]